MMAYMGKYFEKISDGNVKIPFDLKNKKQKILYVQDDGDVYVIVHSFELKNIAEEYDGEVIYEEITNISKDLRLHKCFLEQLNGDEIVIYGVCDRIEIMSKEYDSELSEFFDEEAMAELINPMLSEPDI